MKVPWATSCPLQLSRRSRLSGPVTPSLATAAAQPETYLPSAEPFTPDAEAVTQWLSNFHIVVTE